MIFLQTFNGLISALISLFFHTHIDRSYSISTVFFANFEVKYVLEINYFTISRARIFSWSPGIDSNESIPPDYVARRAGTITLFLLGF
jgi:hypothetical protein